MALGVQSSQVNPKEIFHPSSSLVERVEYNRNSRKLLVSLNGSHYLYKMVSPDTFREFRESDSKGRFFNRVIKQHSCDKTQRGTLPKV